MTKNQNSLTLKVWRCLDQDACLRREMIRGLVNVRALARYIIKEQKMNVSIDAVISAIRRYNLARSEKTFENAKKMIGQVISISTKNRLASIDVTKDSEIQRLLPKLFSIINYNQGDVLRIIHADESINIFIDEKNLEQIKKLLPQGKIIRIYTDLAGINIRIKLDAQNTPGLVALIANELTINNINVMDFMSCVSELLCELLWFVEDSNLMKAYNVINQLWKQNLKTTS